MSGPHGTIRSEQLDFTHFVSFIFFFNITTAGVGTRLTICGARGSTMVGTFRTTLGALWPSRNSVGRRLRPTKLPVSRRTSPIIVRRQINPTDHIYIYVYSYTHIKYVSPWMLLLAQWLFLMDILEIFFFNFEHENSRFLVGFSSS